VGDDIGKDSFNPISYGFCNELKDDITKSNRSEVRWHFRIMLLRNKTDKSMIGLRREREPELLRNWRTY
jgi:hypothetical protein